MSGTIAAFLPISADEYEKYGDWFAAARSYQAADGTTRRGEPWGAWLRELFDDRTQGERS